ncbi:SPW repeat protein [Rhizobium pisi]|uniref:SPW repeat protein n=1 Tax=Rhizobium pisi TaxID=574561 RepID=UPI0039AE9BA4
MQKVEQQGNHLPKLNTVNAIAGAVLFCCPWVLSYDGLVLASISAWIGGLALMVAAVAAATDRWPKLNLVCLSIGVWIFAVPWLLNFSNKVDPATSHFATGVIVMLVSLVCLGGRWITMKPSKEPRP